MINAAIGTVIAIVVAIATALGAFFGITEGQGSSHPGMENISLSSESNAKISKEKALEIALKDAGLTKDQVRIDFGDPEYDFDFEHGYAKWEIDFREINNPRAEYEYEIDATTGAIIKVEKPRAASPKPVETKPTLVATETKISLEEATKIALAHAKVAEADVRIARDNHLDRERGRLVWDIEFRTATHEYDYEIDSETGEIVKFDRELELF